jgi:ankyrin repeat protein
MGGEDRLSLLVAHGAEVTCTDHSGNTPLHRAAEALNYDIVPALIEAGVDPRTVNRRGETARDVALKTGWARAELDLFILPTAKR